MIRLLLWVGWNSFLALIPVGAGFAFAWLAGQANLRKSLVLKLALPALGMIWLAFLPNTCYLLTEWRHFLDLLHREDLIQRWEMGRDPDALIRLSGAALFFLMYSLFGMMTFVIATRPVARVFKRWWRYASLLSLAFFPLLSLGVYLGLVLRFNSWDLLHRPLIVWTAIVEALQTPHLVSPIIVFAFFLWVAYLIVDIWIDGFILRVRRLYAQISAPPCAPELSE